MEQAQDRGAGAFQTRASDEEVCFALRGLQVLVRPQDVELDGPMRPSALREAVGIKSPIHFSRYYLRPLMEKGMIERTDPDSPKSPRQEYKLA